MLLGEVENFNVHRAVFFAFFAADTFVRVQLDMEEGKAAGWFQEDCDRADIFAESPVIFADESQRDADNIIEKIADEKTVPHNSFNVFGMQQEKAADKNQGAGEYNITDKAPFFAGSLRCLKRQQIQNHGCPAGITTPAPAEDKWSEDFGHGIMDGGCFKNTQEQIIPEAFNLHVFMLKKAEIAKHIKTHSELDDMAGVFLFAGKEKKTYGNGCAYVRKIKKIENIVQCPPENHGNTFENQPHNNGGGIFFQHKDLLNKKAFYYHCSIESFFAA